MTYIVYERTDGSIAISTLIGEPDISEVVKKFREAHPGEFPQFTVHETLELPESREHRDKWRIKNGKISVTV
jgi:hypothetical protein